MQTQTIVSVLALALTTISAAALGIARTLIENRTGYLTVGGRVLDAQESLGLLGLPGTILPTVAALLLLATATIRPTLLPLVGLGVAAIAVGQFLPAIAGARSSGAGRGANVARGRLPLDVALGLSLFGLAVLIVATAASAVSDRGLFAPLLAALVGAAAVTVGLQSSGTAFRWTGAPPATVSIGLWLALTSALCTAGIATVAARRPKQTPTALLAFAVALLAGGAMLLAG